MVTWFKNFRLLALWSLFILILTLFPGSYLPRIPDFYQLFKPDKIVHLLLFGIFSFLLLRSILRQYGNEFFRYRGIIIALVIGILFGALTEYLQHSLNINRGGNVYDFIANSAGCIIGLTVFLVFIRKKSSDANAD